MPRENLNDVLAFLAVARQKSFTKAAAQLGVSQSALSHTIRGLESRMGVRLLTRTTRSVAPTQAGERLLTSVGPRFEEIRAELAALSELRDKPSGTVRITAGLHATETILWPKLQPLLKKHPDINVEITVDYGLTNIVSDRYDAGVRLGEQVAKDMIAVRIGPDFRMAVVAAPAYFAKRRNPAHPRSSPVTTASTCDFRPTVGSTRGSSKGAIGRSRCAWRVSSCSTRADRFSTQHWPASASPTCRKTLWLRMSNGDACSAYSSGGAHRSLDITCTTRTVANPRRPWLCWSMRCATGASLKISRRQGAGGITLPSDRALRPASFPPSKEAINCRDHRTTSSKSSAAKISRRRKTKRSSARSLNAGSRLLIRSNLENGARPGRPCAGAGRACRSSHCSDPKVAGESRDRAPVMSVRRSPASERSGALLRQRATLRRGTARRSG